VNEQQNPRAAEDPADATTARLLRVAGARDPVPTDVEQRVRRAVLDEIRALARTRRRRWSVVAAGALLGAAALLVLAVRTRPSDTALPIPAPAIATTERVEGADVTRRLSANAGRLTIAVGEALLAGDEIETGRSGRLAFRWTSGASVRLDHGSRVRLVSATALDLSNGAAYIDSGPGSSGVEVRTPLGLVKDVGTQFETRVDSGGLRVRVRSGLVELHRADEIVPGRPGLEVQVGAAGVTTRTVPTFGPDWEWVTGLAPRFDVNGRTLASFLDYMSREQGWTLTYADPRLARDASGIVVHGSVEGLAAVDALSIVLSTSGLSFRLEAGHLVVSRDRSP
jgi:ferric-dicitrate binding protein FerR (iron transport regulator)